MTGNGNNMDGILNQPLPLCAPQVLFAQNPETIIKKKEKKESMSG